MEEFIFVHWFVQVSRQKTTVKKKITCFPKNYAAFLFTVFEKGLAISKFFYRSVFRCKVFRTFVFYLFEVQTVLVSSLSSSQGENVWI